jgi:hypothetical protein
MHVLREIIEIGTRSVRGRPTRHAGMRTSTQRNDTSGGETSMDEIAAGPVELLDTVVGQWQLLGQYQSKATKQSRCASRRTRLATLRRLNFGIKCFT